MDQGEQAGRTPTGPGAFLPGMFVVAVLLAGIALILDSGRGSDAPSERVNQLVFGSLGLATLALLLWFSQRVGPVREEELDAEAIPLCPNCLVPHPEGLNFCATCGAPLTFFAGTGGYEQIYARAWILGKAAHAPQRRLHLVGLLGWGLPGVASLAYFTLSGPWAGSGSTIMTLQHAGTLIMQLTNIAIALGLIRLSILNLRPVLAQEEDAPARPIYGAPPYWTYDIEAQARLPEEEQDGEVPDGA